MKREETGCVGGRGFYTHVFDDGEEYFARRQNKKRENIVFSSEAFGRTLFPTIYITQIIQRHRVGERAPLRLEDG